jgi:uncharacterized lipoprotein
MNLTKTVLAVALIAVLSGCASWMPDDPYLASKETKALEIPEGLDNPPTDATLTTSIGAGQLVDGGHKPPTVELPDEPKPAAEGAESKQ